jgi:thioesterase domain-containing protein
MSWSSSVIIQSSGSKLPMFWVGINIFLPRHLGPDQPVYGLISQGNYGKPVLYDSVEELAAHHLEEIRMVQPKGPYLLGGFCFWGLVALEIAQQLLSHGEEVLLLCLVEPSPNCFPFTDSCNAFSPPNSSFRSRLVHHQQNLALLPTVEKATYILRELPYLARWIKENIDEKIIAKLKIAFCKACLKVGRPIPLSLGSFFFNDLYNNLYRQAMMNYHARFYPGRATLFHADTNVCIDQPDWSSLASGEMHVHEVAGAGHLNIINEPYVGIWAKQLASHLAELQAKKEDKQPC